MNIISGASDSVLTILKKFANTNNATRWLRYCVQTPVEDGILVFNLLTRELILLTQEEYHNFTELDYLKEHWFVVPEETKEKDYADLVQWVLSARRSKSKEIISYTIFTTTDCNARCFYCFELGRSRIPMSCETAEKVVQFIKNHSGGKAVKISWLGGEPLFNSEAIDIITQGLQKENVEYRSRMTSNGYLFDDAMVQKATAQWNLKQVQITLDGTEKIYNKIKAYIYRDGNPYEIVMSNIARLLDANIRVSVRLNMDLYNAEDLLALSEELAKRFANKKNLTVYAQHLFKCGTPMAEIHTDEEWERRDVAMRRLSECFREHGLSSKTGISKNIRLNGCMADSGNAVTILPDGNVGLCDVLTETGFIGRVDIDGFDAAVTASWKARMPEIPECRECFYFLDCVKLEKCPNNSVCFHQSRQENLRKTQNQMINEYRKWQTKAVDEEEENDDC